MDLSIGMIAFTVSVFVMLVCLNILDHIRRREMRKQDEKIERDNNEKDIDKQ